MTSPLSILITGASGFIGSALVRHLTASKDIHVHALYRKSPSSSPPGVRLITSEFAEELDLSSVLDGIDVVVHTAGRAHVMNEVDQNPISVYRRANVNLTKRLAQQAACAGVKRFIFLSTIKVNGEGASTSRPFSADQSPSPSDAYAISKLEAELELFKIAQETKLEVVIARLPLVYGPGVKGNFAAMVHLVRRGLPLPLGAINNRRSMVALSNLVDFIALCVDYSKSPNAANQVFLVSDGEDVSTTKLIRKVSKAYGVKPRLIPVPALWLSAAARLLGKSAASERLLGSLVIDSSKTRDLLGWVPTVTMDEQLEQMAKHDPDV